MALRLQARITPPLVLRQPYDFNRQFIFSPAHDRHDPRRWLFGGVFEVAGRRDAPQAHSYDIELREDLMGPFIRRLVVNFSPPGRAVRLNMESHIDQIEVAAVLEKPYSGEPFPGHDRINHTFDVLAAVVTQDWQDWRRALHLACKLRTLRAGYKIRVAPHDGAWANSTLISDKTGSST